MDGNDGLGTTGDLTRYIVRVEAAVLQTNIGKNRFGSLIYNPPSCAGKSEGGKDDFVTSPHACGNQGKMQRSRSARHGNTMR